MYSVLLAPLVALLIGIWTMSTHDVSATIAGQNMAAYTLGLALAYFWRPNRYWSLIILLALAATLLFPGSDGVHRWLSLGPFQLNVAQLTMPLLLITLAGKKQAHIWASLTLLVLTLQPDASQATSFALAALFLIRQYRKWTVPLFSVLVALSWWRADNLQPVPHVEQIVGMMSGGMQVGAIVSLLVLLVPFFGFPPPDRQLSFSVGLYFSMTFIMPLIGHFPVPVLGYGTAAILGYMVALGWYIHNKRNMI